jgi:hypothetical protein
MTAFANVNNKSRLNICSYISGCKPRHADLERIGVFDWAIGVKYHPNSDPLPDMEGVYVPL